MTNFEPCAAEVMRRFSQATGGDWIEVAGGVAGFAGVDFPVNAAKGIEGKLGRADLQRLIEFFGDRGKDAVMELAPWVEAESRDALAALGFERVAEEDLMVRPTEALEAEVEVVDDPEAWARVLSMAFFGEWNELGRSIGHVMQGIEGSLSIGIWEGADLVAAGQMMVVCGAALLSGDATLPEWRGRGLQQRLIRGRVAIAWEQGAEWAHCEVLPASTSQRNYERCGFVKAYHRVHYVRPLRNF